MTDLEEYVNAYVEWLPGMTWDEALALAKGRDALAASELEWSVWSVTSNS